MAEAVLQEGFVERWSRRLRDVHAIGAAAVLSAGVLFPPILAASEATAGLLALDAGGWEIMHRTAKHRRESQK